MPSPRITAGERRGLIILLIVIIIATVMLCRRDRSLTHSTPAEATAIAPTVTPLRPSKPDSNGVTRTKKHRKNRTGKASPSPAPRPRSPRDEQVN